MKKKAPRVGRTPDLLRKGGPMKDRKKYDRKNKKAIDDITCPKGGRNIPSE